MRWSAGFVVRVAGEHRERLLTSCFRCLSARSYASRCGCSFVKLGAFMSTTGVEGTDEFAAFAAGIYYKERCRFLKSAKLVKQRTA